MTSGATFLLNSGFARKEARRAIDVAHEGTVVELRPAKRTLDQNSRLHACIADIIKSGYQLHGKTFDVDDWKTFFVSVWMGETGRSRLERGINNELVQLYWRTSRMSREQLGEVLILVEKFCAERGIQLRSPPDGETP